jgi:hypothetical protein
LGNALGDSSSSDTNKTKEAPEESFQQKYRKQMKKDLDEIESMDIDEETTENEAGEDIEIELKEEDLQESLTIDDILGADEEEE